MERSYSKLDRIIATVDAALRLSTGAAPAARRANPGRELEPVELDERDNRHVAGLMRINHSGEICAQALYAGQAATAHDDATREAMKQAAEEEIDHLSWCEDRLKELGSHPSLLNPLWYAGSFAIGAVAGLAGDAWSLGFVKETETQVEAHLQDHIERLPGADARSQAILDQMKEDEARHAEMAEQAGARDLPAPVRRAMAFSAGIMKALAYRI
ncbi:MAG: 2-polyprenyl-3-methyl-6-methoxy-1,4-benzoquinone monooxygenase [Xanthomonadales bacterium]|nr:2-polyprenyl-3-methyl-6-methoxy-1,4-benzoquinone monooxygenase [Xanthomonadales bacterium]